MRTVIHLSDLHFGTEDLKMVGELRAQLAVLRPDLVVISGDLTQRAREEQFGEARRFLGSLPFNMLVVPGNHDVAPWHTLIERLFWPMRRYSREISENLAPFYQDEEIAVAGINTARGLAFKGGRISRRQTWETCRRLGSPERVRIVVTHHPFDLPQGGDPEDITGGAERAMQSFAECRIDMFLSGHLHISQFCETAHRYRIKGHSAIAAQAGTAVSRRLRGEANSWNLITVSRPLIAITRMEWHQPSETFTAASREEFQHSAEGWSRAKDPICHSR